jgi:phage regulator Rha-like protein
MTDLEYDSLRSQIATLKSGRGEHRKYIPYVFTEHGVAMLSSVLNSERAVQVNIQIIRTFSRLKEIILARKDLSHKLSELEKRVGSHDEHIQSLFDVIKQIMNPPQEEKKKIGFKN